MFVNVPNVPGVPPVLFASASGIADGLTDGALSAVADAFGELDGVTGGALSLLTGDTFSYFAGTFGPQWGIFRGPLPVVTADLVASFEFRQEWVLADYPVEGGSFETYDKVATPFHGRLRFASGGSEANRSALLESVEAIAGDLNIYDIVTPEKVYENVNISHFDYRRTALNGVGLLVIDLWCQEVRIANAQQSGGTTQAPSGTTAQNGGTVQAQSPTPSQRLPQDNLFT